MIALRNFSSIFTARSVIAFIVFSNCFLSGAVLSGAVLSGAVLSGAVLAVFAFPYKCYRILVA